MNWTMILGVLCGLMAAVLLLTIGYVSGKQVAKDEAEKNKEEDSERYLEGPGIGLQGPTGPMGATGNPGPPGRDGETPDARNLIVDPDLELSLMEWKAAVESRLTRVEKKAGMSV